MAVNLPISPISPLFADAFSTDFPHEETNLLLQTLLTTAPIVSLRHHRIKLARFPHTLDCFEKAKAIPWCQEAYWLSERPEFALDPLWHTGSYYVQEAASMAIALIKEHLPKHPLRALDLCAAPGGKSTLLADLLPSGSTLLCNEPIYKRATVLAENMVKWGFPETIVTAAFPAQLSASGLSFDFILVDAPCSGEGMFRKSEPARTDWSPQTVEICALRQQEILDEAWKMLRPGGLLLYSTCTFNKRENEENVTSLLRRGASITPLSIESGWGFSPSEGGLGYHSFPHRVAGEGFFFVLLQKPVESEEPGAEERDLTYGFAKKEKKEKRRRGKAPSQDEKKAGIPSVATAWLREEYRCSTLLCEEPEGHFFVLPQALQKDYLCLKTAGISILHAGIPFGKAKGNTFQPDGKLHFSLAFQPEAFPQYSLDKAEALQYLAGISPEVCPPFRGIGLVRYCGVPLGFVNAVGKRFNNLYPKGFRLRQLPR